MLKLPIHDITMKFQEIFTKTEQDIGIKNYNFAFILSPTFSIEFYKKPPFSMTEGQTEKHKD